MMDLQRGEWGATILNEKHARDGVGPKVREGSAVLVRLIDGPVRMALAIDMGQGGR